MLSHHDHYSDKNRNTRIPEIGGKFANHYDRWVIRYTQLSHNEHNESIDHLEFVLNASEQGALNTVRSTILVKGPKWKLYREASRNVPTKVVLNQRFY